MKKFISLVLSLLLVCSMLVAVPTVSAVTYDKGSEIEATVIMPDVTEINGIEAKLTYGDSLELVSVTTPNFEDAVVGEHSNLIYINATKASAPYTMADSVLCVVTFTTTEDIDVIDFAATVNQAYVLDGTEFIDVPTDVVVTYKINGEVPTEPTEPTETETETTQPKPTNVPITQPTTEVPTVELSNTYALIGIINGKDVGIDEDYASADILFDENGICSYVFTETSYVTVKTADNSAYYWSKGSQYFETVLYSNMGYYEMLTVPSGYVEFKLVERADGSLKLSYVASEVVPTEPTQEPTDSTTDPNTEPSSETDPTSTVESSETTPTIAKEYSLAGYIDGKGIGCNGDWQSDPYIFVDGKVTMTTTQENMVFVKTTDDQNWFFLPEMSTDTSAVFYSTGCNEMMYVPAGTVTFTLVENEDGTLTLSYVVESVPTIPSESESTTPSESESTTPSESESTTPSESESTAPSESESTTPSESESTAPSESESTAPSESESTAPTESESTTPSDTTPAPAKEYSLAGYINNADVGFNGDYVNDPYIFVDGTVTVTFDSDSYVFVKTTDDTTWYMTDAYCTDTTCVLNPLPSTTGEKMFVPAGTVTFTLIENEDGTLTLSYTVATETTPSESESTTPSESESTAPSESESTAPSESESTAPSESESTAPSESESTAPSESESTAPSESESTAPSESESTAPTESESTAPSQSESTVPTTPTSKPTQPTTAAKKPYLDKTSVSLKAGDTVTLKVMDNVSGAKVKFSTNDTSIVKVSGKGKVTARSKGTATITATVGSTKLTCKIKVTTNPKFTDTKGKKITKITVQVGKTTKVLISGKAAKLKNQYKSTAYVKVTGGKQKPFIKIKGLKAGKSTIQVKVNGSKTIKLKVTVK